MKNTYEITNYIKKIIEFNFNNIISYDEFIKCNYEPHLLLEVEYDNNIYITKRDSPTCAIFPTYYTTIVMEIEISHIVSLANPIKLNNNNNIRVRFGLSISEKTRLYIYIDILCENLNHRNCIMNNQDYINYINNYIDYLIKQLELYLNKKLITRTTIFHTIFYNEN